MPCHRLLLVASIAFLATPLAAGETDVKAPRQSANGEFMFDHYPPRALAAREQGRVGFRVNVDREGSLTSCDVTQSSGSAALDRETCELMIRYARFQPVRTTEGATVAVTHVGYVNWRLPAELAGKAAAPATATGEDPDEVICKRQLRTGSLVAKSKVCMTRKEWTLATRRTQDEWGELQGKGFSPRQ